MALVAFDFDGTLSDDEMIVLLGERAGCADEIAAITARAMAGELAYAESLRRRASLLAGLPVEEAAAAYAGVELRPGAGGLLRELTSQGVTTAILTGGFAEGVEAALDRVGVRIDHLVANRLPAEDGRLTGEVDGPLVEGTKDDALLAVCSAAGVDPGEAVAVGDGANDLPMLEVAGTAIGFRPKPPVRRACDRTVATVRELRAALAEAGVL